MTSNKQKEGFMNLKYDIRRVSGPRLTNTSFIFAPFLIGLERVWRA